jgi:F-type H+-transporting ATPase subunit a
MESVLGSRRHAEKYLPLVATIFLFILFSNWLGLLPGVGSFIIHEDGGRVPLLRSPASDLNFTLALAITAVLAVNVLGVAALGAAKHGKKFFNFSNPIAFFVGILELISEFARMISFSFRLFGNVFAGEVLLVIMAFLVPYLIPLPFLFLELFVGFIQAFIFAMLTLVFTAAAVAEGH